MENEFRATYNFFKNTFDSLGIFFPIPYEVWQTIPCEYQSAALFCNFYKQISLVWYKVSTPESSDADCVSTTLMYLQRNVHKIMGDKNRYTEAYIYTVVYNSIVRVASYPHSKTTGSNGYYSNTVPNIVIDSEGNESLLSDVEAIYLKFDQEFTDTEQNSIYAELWDIIESLDDDSQKVVYGLMSGRVRIDGVPSRKRKKIIEKLKMIFSDFR